MAVLFGWVDSNYLCRLGLISVGFFCAGVVFPVCSLSSRCADNLFTLLFVQGSSEVFACLPGLGLGRHSDTAGFNKNIPLTWRRFPDAQVLGRPSAAFLCTP